jgi:formylglycine-generating enzyme required for sulfatase activity
MSDAEAKTDAETPPPLRTKLRWYQYSLKSLLVFTTIVGLAMGLVVVPVHWARQQWGAIQTLRDLGWVVTCDPTPSGPAWARKVFGDEMFHDAVAVDSPPGASDDEMEHLGHMPELERVYISGENVTDVGVSRLAGFPKLKIVCLSGTSVGDDGARQLERLENLEQLYLTQTKVTDEGVRELQEMLPGCKVWRLEETTNSIGMKFVLIPAGEFMMGSPAWDQDQDLFGSERPQHRVRITKPFYLGVHEVTQAQYEAVMGSRPWSGQQYVKEDADYPATYVRWKEATVFCEKLSAKEGRTYRLATEAEWEYACRAGSSTGSFFGDDSSASGNHAWHYENAWNVGEEYAHAVGRKKPNGWGLYDMHGNVWEWCSDWRDGGYYKESPVDDPTGPSSGDVRVVRGGGWHYSSDCRAAYRPRGSPDPRGDDLGFRVALVPTGR